MKFTTTAIPDVILIEPQVFEDGRGFFIETWQARKFAEADIPANFVQDNLSRSSYGTLRGLHYQVKKPQGKLVTVMAGEVFDVAVDLRKNSRTFGHWIGERLSVKNRRMLWIPAGFAHGFYVLSEQADFFYKCTDFWAPEHERCICWNDPTLSIAWPIAGYTEPLVSEKDAIGVAFQSAEVYP
jgi:dTDP-4-dehydrorhamnose 3,5-epimerase